MPDTPVARATSARDAAVASATNAATMVARGMAWDMADGPCPDGLIAVRVAETVAAAAMAADSWARCACAADDDEAVWHADAAEYHAATAAAAAGLV